VKPSIPIAGEVVASIAEARARSRISAHAVSRSSPKSPDARSTIRRRMNVPEGLSVDLSAHLRGIRRIRPMGLFQLLTA
jgi:hypothetical protein